MHPAEVKSRIESAARLYEQGRHPDSLSMLEAIGHLLPNSPVLMLMRVENLSTAGQTTEAVHECDKLVRRVHQIRQAGDILDDLLDIDQSFMLSEMLTNLADRAGTLKNDLGRRQAEALDKETLQTTVTQLRARIDTFMSQREQDTREQQQLTEELSRMRQQDQLTNKALEKAHSDLDAMKHTLLQRESEIEEAENELASRKERVALLENEVATLQKRSASAEKSKHILDEELERLRTQGDEKTKALNAARIELSRLQGMLHEHELAVDEARKNTRRHEEAIAQMQGQLAGMRDESKNADRAKEDLVAEIEQLRANEWGKSEALETTRSEIAHLESTLHERENDIAAEESQARDTRQAAALLKSEFDALTRIANEEVLKEAELAQELAQLRQNESTKAAALETTRSEMERIVHELQQREARQSKPPSKNAGTSETARARKEKLDQLKSKASEFENSEQLLLQELEQLRANEAAKSIVLEEARAELHALRGRLDHKKSAVAEAERTALQHDAAANALRAELTNLQTRAQSASDSENTLSAELALLRENEAAKNDALAAAQAEMEQLRRNLALREKDAEDAEALSAEKQRELDRLQQELAAVQNEAAEAQGAESALQREREQLRKSEEEKNRALEQSRLQLEALKKTLNEREEAAARAAREQEESRRTIAALEDELAALRNREHDTATSQVVLQDEVDQINSEVQKEARLDQTPQAQQLGEILGQLREMQKAQLEAQRLSQQRAQALAAASQDSDPMAVIPRGPATLRDSQRQTQPETFSAPAASPSKRQSKLGALNVAARQASNQQAGRNTAPVPQQPTQQPPLLRRHEDRLLNQQEPIPMRRHNDPLPGPQQPPPSRTQWENLDDELAWPAQHQSPLDALNATQQQSSGATEAARTALADKTRHPSTRQTAQPAPNAAQKTTQPQAQQPPASAATALPDALVTDDDLRDVVEDYPKPRDAAFVYPNQSVSIAVPPKKRRGRLFLPAVSLVLLIALLALAYFVQSHRAQPAAAGKENTQAQVPTEKKAEEERPKTIIFPPDRIFGSLYDHEAPHTNDTDWPLYAPAKGAVEYPAKARFHLEVSKDCAADLSPLNALPPNAIESMRLPSFDMSDKNIAALRHLTGISVIFIDQEMPEADLQKLRASLEGRKTVTCRQPDDVIRGIAPPAERVLAFPEGKPFGFIAFRPWHRVEEEWQQFGPAKGNVTIPAGMEVKLSINEGISDLSALKSLAVTDIHTLVLSGAEINDASMDGPAFLRGLLVLELSGTAVTDAGIRKLARNVGMQELKLTNTRIGDDGIDVLKKIPQLERLYIDGAPNITAGSLKTFRDLLALKRLHLANTAVSAEELAQLARDKQSCAITPAA